MGSTSVLAFSGSTASEEVGGVLAGTAAKPVAVVVEDAINGLVGADQTLKTGGAQLPALSYEQARDLVAAVAAISGRPIALFLDQWEKSPDVGREANFRACKHLRTRSTCRHGHVAYIGKTLLVQQVLRDKPGRDADAGIVAEPDRGRLRRPFDGERSTGAKDACGTSG
jgi:hypothetical protein